MNDGKLNIIFEFNIYTVKYTQNGQRVKVFNHRNHGEIAVCLRVYVCLYGNQSIIFFYIETHTHID